MTGTKINIAALALGLCATLAAAYAFRWEVTPGPMGTQYVVRTNRWTGEMVRCQPASVFARVDPQPGDVFACER